MKDMRGKTALVTGGAVRIGRAICEALAERGCRVAVHYRRSADRAAALVRRLRAGGAAAFAVKGDLSTSRGCRQVVRNAFRRAGTVDFLVNNAAEFRGPGKGAACARLVRVNLVAPVCLAIEFAKRTGFGGIVNLLDSDVALDAGKCGAYLLTKKLLAEQTLRAAVALAPGISVNGVAPGPVLPPPRVKGHRRVKAGPFLLARKPSARDVAAAVVFLLESDSITGEIVYVDSGRRLAGARFGRAGRGALSENIRGTEEENDECARCGAGV